MSKTIRITCSAPGFRRHGISFPAEKIFGPGELSDGLVEKLRRERVLRIETVNPADAATPPVPPLADGGGEKSRRARPPGAARKGMSRRGPA